MASTSSSPLPMLIIPEKKPHSADLLHPLRAHIAATFSPDDAASSEKELNLLSHMRADLENQISFSSLGSRLDLLQRYYRALSVIERRLGRVSSIAFTWYDAFRLTNRRCYQSIEFEKSAVLFNIGAVHAQIGAVADRGTVEGRRVAYSEFEKGADAFRLLKESGIAGRSVDLTTECAGMLEKLMLAQAQECVFDKVISDSKRLELCSKVAQQAGNFYKEAYVFLTSPTLVDHHFGRSFISHILLKSAYFCAEAVCLYCKDLHQKGEIGEEIARLQLASGALSDAKRHATNVTSALFDAATRLKMSMKQNLERAVTDNNQVYYMRIPPVNTLSELQGAIVAHHVSISEALDISNETIFSNLVPDSSKKILEKYSNTVDDLIIRVQADKIEQGREIIRAKLHDLGLPDSLVIIENGFKFPNDVKLETEAIQESGGPRGLEIELNKLKDLRRVNIELIKQIEEMLIKEEREDSNYRADYKEKWNRLKSTELTKNVRERISKYNEDIKEAAICDAKVEQSLTENHALMIESVFPSIARPVIHLNGVQDKIITSLKQSLNQLETLGAQLPKLEKNLKETKAKDDILPRLLASTLSEEDLFQEEIEKYNPICSEISTNIQSQEQLMLQIETQNYEFANLYKVVEYKVACEYYIKQIRFTIANFHEIKENMSGGLNFYATLQEALNNLKQQTSDFVMVRNNQCSEMVKNLESHDLWRLFEHKDVIFS